MNNNLSDLKSRFDTLAVFRDLLSDSVIASFMRYFDSRSPSDYCEFVSLLYKANGGNLTDYVEKLLADSENVYVQILGSGKAVPEHIFNSAMRELDIISEMAHLAPPEDKNFPKYAVSDTDIVSGYKKRADNISCCGYGIYAATRMFNVSDLGEIIPVNNADSTAISDLVCYERQRDIVIRNTKALLCGQPAANILLTGDAGTGKSSTVKAVCNAFFDDGLRLIEVRKEQLGLIPKILNSLALNPLKFILFIDDLSFLTDDDNFNGLKAVLEGSVAARPKNVVVYATSNRRHIVKESFSDRGDDDVHVNETMQEIISLSDRFGIHITFERPNKEAFLDIVKKLATAGGVTLPDSELFAGAERFSLAHGGRSPRLARQFVDSLISRSAFQ